MAKVCEHCGGEIEASSKVYLDVELADGTITNAEFSGVNDFWQGHPLNLESELHVSCANCGTEVDYKLGVLADADMQAERFKG